MLLEGLRDGRLQPQTLPLILLLGNDFYDWTDNPDYINKMFTKMLVSCENQHREYVKRKLLELEEKNPKNKLISKLHKLMKLSKNA